MLAKKHVFLKAGDRISKRVEKEKTDRKKRRVARKRSKKTITEDIKKGDSNTFFTNIGLHQYEDWEKEYEDNSSYANDLEQMDALLNEIKADVIKTQRVWTFLTLGWWRRFGRDSASD